MVSFIQTRVDIGNIRRVRHKKNAHQAVKAVLGASPLDGMNESGPFFFVVQFYHHYK